ncbi:MAG: hypothetical protein ACRYFS_00950 [Janthinobacterium lividum]
MTATVCFDAQTMDYADFGKIVQDGTLLSTAGILNLLWEDFSAVEAARDLDLHGVDWEAVRDSTPGTLTCIIRYDTLSLPELQQRLLTSSVFEYEISSR